MRGRGGGNNRGRQPRAGRLIICAAISFSIIAIQSMFQFQAYAEDYVLVQDEEGATNALITLVTGFWAQADNATIHPHRREIEASLVANIENPYFHQVVVVLDSASKENHGCSNFLGRIDELRNETGTSSSARMSCLERHDGQPNYFEMFQYALHPLVEGEVVVMSNADQVFDDSMKYASDIPLDVIWTLSTLGCAPQIMPMRLMTTYRRLVGEPFRKNLRRICPSRCVIDPGLSSFRKYSVSWDTYIFHPATIRSSLNSASFARPNFNRLPTQFFMNEYGAENAALHGISKDLVHDSVAFWNACRVISSWHFHFKNKMHKTNIKTAIWPKMRGGIIHFDDGSNSSENKPGDFVPKPYAYPPMCSDREECISSFQPARAVRYSTPPIDAATGNKMTT